MLRRLPLPLVAALFVATVRTLVAISRVDELELERYSASVAWAFINGLPLNPEQLPIISHLRGSFLFGLLLVPVISVFGPHVIALKFLAIAVSAVTAALAAALAARHLGLVAAWVVVLLFAIAPPAFQMVDVLAMGSHVDTLPFLLLPLLLVLRLPSDTPARRWSVFVLGASVGLAVLFSYQALVALPGWLLLWCLRQPPSRAWLTRVPVGALGFAATAAWIPLLTRDMKVANHSVLEKVGAIDTSTFTTKLVGAVVEDVPCSWGYDQQGLAFIAAVVAALAILGWVLAVCRTPRTLCAWRSDRTRQLVVAGLVHTIALLVAYGAVELKADLTANLDGMAGRYFLPLWPAIAFAVAYTCQWLANRVHRRVAWSVVGGVGVLGAVATWPLIDPACAFTQPKMSAIDMHAFRDHIAHASNSLSEQLDWIEALDPSWQEFHPHHYLCGQVQIRPGPDGLRRSLGNARLADARLVPYICVTAGSRLGTRVTSSDTPPREWAAKLVRDAQPLLSALSGESERRWFWRGVGRSYAVAAAQWEIHVRWGRLSPQMPSDTLLGLVDFGADAEAVCEGAGFQLGLRASPYQPPEQAYLARIHLAPPHLRAVILRAVGWGYRIRFVEQGYFPPRDLRFERCLPESERVAFHEGLAWSGGPP